MPDVYDATITGAADGLPDFDYILKSYSGIHYSGLTSHLRFQFPRQNDDIKGVTDRPNGEIILRKNGFELYRGTPESVDFFNGASASTFSISATYLTTETTPKTVTAQVELIDTDYDGKRIFKLPGYHDFQPLDSLFYNSETIEIDQVRIIINAESTYLKLREL